jgi:hypothetical protein
MKLPKPKLIVLGKYVLPNKYIFAKPKMHFPKQIIPLIARNGGLWLSQGIVWVQILLQGE